MKMIQKRLSFCSLLIRLRIILLLIFLKLEGRSLVSARLIDGEDLLVGNWKTTFRCNPTFFTSELFPLKLSNSNNSPHNPIDDNPRSLFQRAIKSVTPSKTYRCNLTFFPNRTFALVPEDILDANIGNRLCLHGVWNLQANPYCATDRFYDQLVLKSYPRSMKQLFGCRSKNQPAIIRKHIKLRLHCRLFGHYSASRPRNSNRFARGRLSHGVLFVSREHIQDHTSKQIDSYVAGSFSGSRVFKSQASLQSLLEENDVQQFGY
jgi:hypothetical protein